MVGRRIEAGESGGREERARQTSWAIHREWYDATVTPTRKGYLVTSDSRYQGSRCGLRVLLRYGPETPEGLDLESEGPINMPMEWGQYLLDRALEESRWPAEDRQGIKILARGAVVR